MPIPPRPISRWIAQRPAVAARSAESSSAGATLMPATMLQARDPRKHARNGSLADHHLALLHQRSHGHAEGAARLMTRRSCLSRARTSGGAAAMYAATLFAFFIRPPDQALA